MAVFTDVSTEQAQALLDTLALGELQALKGITAGIENTNYFVTTVRGGESHEYVLTIFERLSFEQLPFYLELMRHLARKGVPVPAPQPDAQDRILHTIAGKPAAVVDKLRGGHQLAPDQFHCEQVGAGLARMHLAGQDFPLHQDNLRGLPWWRETVPLVLPHLAPDQAALLKAELAFQEQLAPSAAALPRGPIHADLFRDNVMFDGLPGREMLSGFFDFYFAGVDIFLFDLCVCLNDWCIDLDSGRLDEQRATAFVKAYESVRPLSGAEHRLLPGLLRAAALRFWISRLWDFHLPREASLLKPHDPTHFERVLRERIAKPWHALESLP
ncbi:homoserine kinase [Mitsuaria sp. PDC51]|uniref:homoserine kinase n=1 Tax=unclassified Roseateles TaxID=2626991 RepID=UPI0008DF089F|nr:MULTISPECIES: homoserine kinase [unclassified Roseateles]MBB3282464.1 homoserine kinase type II [Mitsuaria sp. BK037]SFR85694.1 homoserine kinase [Mitsuaria sp. PDC51]